MRDPIFAESPSSKISLSNFRGWTFQSCSTHNIPPLTARAPWLKSRWNRLKVVKNKQAIDRSYLYLEEIEKWYESHVIEARDICVELNNELV